MSIQQNFPGFIPSLNLNFARSKRLDPRVTFVRQTGATVTNELGLIERVGNNVPRFDHTYDSTGAIRSLGLLIEEQRENILNRSEVTTSNWTGSTSNTTYSNLSLNALGIFPGVEVTSTTGAAWHRRTTGSNVPFVSGTQYAVTFYYREGTSGRARLQFRYNSQESYVQGPANGSAWSIQQTLGSITNVTTTLMDGQSTYKTSYIFTPNFTGVADMGIGVGLEGSPGVTIIALGGQVEVGAFPTSYIPTQGLPVTRLADRATIDGQNFSSWYNQIEGTYFMSTKIAHTPNPTVSLLFRTAATGGPRVSLEQTTSNTLVGIVENIGAYFFSTSGSGLVPANQFRKTSLSYISTNGITTVGAATNLSTLVDTASSADVNKCMNTLYLGRYGDNAYYLNGHIQQFVYYPRKISNSQLQQLTR